MGKGTWGKVKERPGTDFQNLSSRVTQDVLPPVSQDNKHELPAREAC